MANRKRSNGRQSSRLTYPKICPKCGKSFKASSPAAIWCNKPCNKVIVSKEKFTATVETVLRMATNDRWINPATQKLVVWDVNRDSIDDFVTKYGLPKISSTLERAGWRYAPDRREWVR
jgi:hypothetical protein